MSEEIYATIRLAPVFLKPITATEEELRRHRLRKKKHPRRVRNSFETRLRRRWHTKNLEWWRHK